MASLRSRLLRLHAGWIHVANFEPVPDSAPGVPAGSSPAAPGASVSGPAVPALDPIGGQAVVEGVLMRAPDRIAIAARAPDGRIATHSRTFVPFHKRHPLLKLPVVRGGASLAEALYVGTHALNWSAKVQESRDEASGETVAAPSGTKERFFSILGLVLSFTLALGLFQLLPYAVASFVAGGTREAPANPVVFNATAGLVRISLLVTYLWALSFLPDVRRLFQYHGAEHKTIFAHEGGAGLSPDAVAAQTRFHPRCGTSFILIVALTCVLFFSVFDAILLHGIGYAYPNFFVRFLVHLPFVPVVAGLSFEVLKLTARHQQSAWVRPLVLPGLWLQRITTREPDAAQVEVALASARTALAA